MVRPVAPRDLDAEAESAPSESFATLERGANKVGEFMDSSREVVTTALNAREKDVPERDAWVSSFVRR